VFGQEDVTIGAVGQGVFGKLAPALFVGFLEGRVHERLGLAQRRVLVGFASQLGDSLLHQPLQRPAVGQISRALGAAFRLLAVRFSLLPGHRTRRRSRETTIGLL